MGEYAAIEKEAKLFTELCVHNDAIDPNLFDEFGVKRGLRDKDGNGVLAGITNISRIDAFEMRDGVKTPCDGKLWYRGYNVYDLIRGLRGKRYGFEEVAYLLLLGDLPNEQQLHEFTDCLTKCRALPSNFVRDVIMKAPSKDLMNSLTRSVLTLASYDPKVSDLSISNVLRQSIQLAGIFPMLAVYSYHAYNHYEKDGSMYIHRPDPELSTAENFLRMLRPDMQYTPISKLSGGEKRRLYLLSVLVSGANVLILDEPSNDVDIPTVTILEDYLNAFSGIVITVSHDRYFLDNVVDRIFEFDGNGTLRQYEGGYTDYREAKERRFGETGAISSVPGGEKEKKEKSTGKDWKQNRPTKLKFTYKEQREYETIDDDIVALEEKIEKLDDDMVKNATNSGKLAEIMREKEAAEAQLEEKMDRWVYLNDLAEQIEAQKSGN